MSIVSNMVVAMDVDQYVNARFALDDCHRDRPGSANWAINMQEITDKKHGSQIHVTNGDTRHTNRCYEVQGGYNDDPPVRIPDYVEAI